MPQFSRTRRGRLQRDIVMPAASVGLCRVQRCRVIDDLAEGLCVAHWDRGMDRADHRHKPTSSVE